MKSFIQTLVEWGHRPDDPEEEKLKKSSLLVVSGPFALAGLIWGVLYFANGLVLPGAIPFGYGILSIASMITFGITKQYTFFRNSQLTLILFLPFALQVSLGGFISSSAVIYWSIIAPAGAMFFDSVRRSAYWFAAYLVLVVLAYLVDDLLPGFVNWNLSEEFIETLFLLNIIGVSCLVYGILYYFVSTITELNRDIEEKNRALQEMDEIKSRFFANISHEFRTPLTLILGLVNRRIARGDNPADAGDNLTIRRNAQKLLQLINQLLDLSKLESGEMKLQASRGDIVTFVKKVTAQYELMAASRDIGLIFNGRKLDEQFGFERVDLYFDQDKMSKVVNNLLSNALKFTPGGGDVAVEVEKARKPDRDGSDRAEAVIIRVINTGAEIPADKLPHIFDRFYQVESASNRNYEGTGIGLALVKDLVELHHGEVSVTSRMRKTTFTVTLPFLDESLSEEEIVEADRMDTEIEPVSAAPVALRNTDDISGPEEADLADEKLEVLVVEDNRDLRDFIRKILEESYSVIEATDGVDGYEKATGLIPDLIVSDVMMPGMDGYELSKKLKEDRNTDHIPIVLLTAKAERENKLEGLETGADAYLVKPFDEEELKVRIKNLIEVREKLQHKFRGELMLKPQRITVASRQQQFMENLKQAVEKNIDNEQFGVEELGKAIGMSRSQLHRKLKALTDQSASTYIRNYRLYRGADLLKQDAGNITEIAYRVGFNSQSYFSTCFQELFGCTPSEYRKREHSG